jgi:hypothetical protein
VTASDWAAWVGAIGGSISLALQIVQHWKRGAKLRVTVFVHDVPFMSVRNIGDSPTTVTSVNFHTSEDGDKQSTFEEYSAKVLDPKKYDGTPLPCKLEPGEVWTIVMKRGPTLDALQAEKTLWCYVHHTMEDEPLIVRVPTPTHR